MSVEAVAIASVEAPVESAVAKRRSSVGTKATPSKAADRDEAAEWASEAYAAVAPRTGTKAASRMSGEAVAIASVEGPAQSTPAKRRSSVGSEAYAAVAPKEVARMSVEPVAVASVEEPTESDVVKRRSSVGTKATPSKAAVRDEAEAFAESAVAMRRSSVASKTTPSKASQIVVGAEWASETYDAVAPKTGTKAAPRKSVEGFLAQTAAANLDQATERRRSSLDSNVAPQCEEVFVSFPDFPGFYQNDCAYLRRYLMCLERLQNRTRCINFQRVTKMRLSLRLLLFQISGLLIRRL